MECFAFGGATVRLASLETSFHAANHTIPPPPSYEGLPLCPKDKNRSPFHGEKPLIENDFLKRGCTIPTRFCMVGTRYFESTEKVGRGAILPFFLLITYGHSQLSIIGGVRFFVAGGVRAFGGEALVQVADFVVVLLKKKGGLFV
ncbi:MAG: hypothetical protein SOW13_03440 [Sodaliphilus sp.]|nr:hypothetical protein [Sodaliphilus sp.]